MVKHAKKDPLNRGHLPRNDFALQHVHCIYANTLHIEKDKGQLLSMFPRCALFREVPLYLNVFSRYSRSLSTWGPPPPPLSPSSLVLLCRPICDWVFMTTAERQDFICLRWELARDWEKKRRPRLPLSGRLGGGISKSLWKQKQSSGSAFQFSISHTECCPCLAWFIQLYYKIVCVHWNIDNEMRRIRKIIWGKYTFFRKWQLLAS